MLTWLFFYRWRRAFGQNQDSGLHRAASGLPCMDSFVDAGRMGIFGFDELFNLPDPIQDMSDERHCARLEQAAGRKVTLPLLLPLTLSRIATSKLKDKNIEQLTKATMWIEADEASLRAQHHLPCPFLVRLLEPRGLKWQLKLMQGNVCCPCPVRLILKKSGRGRYSPCLTGFV